MNCIYGIIIFFLFVIGGWIIVLLGITADKAKCKKCWSFLTTEDLIEGKCSFCGIDVDWKSEL